MAPTPSPTARRRRSTVASTQPGKSPLKARSRSASRAAPRQRHTPGDAKLVASTTRTARRREDDGPDPRVAALLLVVGCLLCMLERRTGSGLRAVKLAASRATAAYLHLPPGCPDNPADVPRETYTFPAVEGWPGDDAFWAHLPCSRDSYRVVVPDAMRRGSDVPAGGNNCAANATVVTSFFDIGRAGWGGVYARSWDTYLRDAREVLFTLPNTLVFFTQPDLVDVVLAEREAHGLRERTVVVGMAHACMPTAGLWNATAQAMCAPGYLDYFWETWAPEQSYPWYSLVMWAKIDFVSAAGALTLPALASTPYLVWLDAGCHWPVCRGPVHTGMCLAPWRGSNTSRLRIAAPEPLTPGVAAMTDAELHQAKRMLLAGTVFGGGRDAIASARAAFHGKVAELLAAGMPDMDQPVWSMLLKAGRAADILEPYYTAYEWDVVLDWFGAPPEHGDMSPVRATEGRWKLP